MNIFDDFLAREQRSTEFLEMPFIYTFASKTKTYSSGDIWLWYLLGVATYWKVKKPQRQIQTLEIYKLHKA